MKFKNIPDQEVTISIRKGDYSILPTLFERNYVNALNFGDKYDLSQKDTQAILTHSVLIIWQYFSSKSYSLSKHKIDFMIDFVFKRLIQYKLNLDSIKIKSRFEELDPLIAAYINEPKENDVINVINNFKLLKDRQKELIWNNFFEQRTIDDLANQLSISEEKATISLHKGFIKWADLIRTNLKRPINTKLLQDQVETLSRYSVGKLSKDKMLQHELNLAENKELEKLQNTVDELAEIARLSRRLSLRDYVSKNINTKLTGNIWGNKTSIISAVFIIIIGILVWISNRTPQEKKNIFNFKIEQPDSVNSDDATNKLP